MEISLEFDVSRSRRIQEVEELFSLPAATKTRRSWDARIPIDEEPWSIGLIVGPSGAGKSTICNRIFPGAKRPTDKWSDTTSIVESFPATMSTKDITRSLTGIGFSTVPAWIRPFRTLSTGEQFRASVARTLATAHPGETILIDEFTSNVDREAAAIAAAATAKEVRRRGVKLIASTCHYDVLQWLSPDWTYEPHTSIFQWHKRIEHPTIELSVYRAKNDAWETFKHHHYLSADQNNAAQKFVAVNNNRMCAMTSVLWQPHPQRPGWREHRTVCLPDYQGIGLGNALADFVAAMYVETNLPYRSVTSHPAMIYHRAKSKHWAMKRPPSMMGIDPLPGWQKTSSTNRMTATFEYIGPGEPEAAAYYGIIDEPDMQRTNQ